MKKLVVFAATMGLLWVVNAGDGFAQQSKTGIQATKSKSDTLKPKHAGKKKKKAAAPIKEIELGEINIEAIIEKPNVDIFPKRIVANVEEISFIDRTFEQEIKQLPKDLLLFDEELDSAKKLSKLRKELEKMQKKLKKAK
ncbi:MAG: hypothetical protein D6814_13715 [Calditrichaeota bacterium]|nr:MAG: hypothetical protein D6814_13715 [Calditrichota bacterium]